MCHFQIPRVSVCDDGLQCNGIHIPQVDMRLFALAQSTHKHCPETHKEEDDFTEPRLTEKQAGTLLPSLVPSLGALTHVPTILPEVGAACGQDDFMAVELVVLHQQRDVS